MNNNKGPLFAILLSQKEKFFDEHFMKKTAAGKVDECFLLPLKKSAESVPTRSL